jgi:hypothetical protein
VKRRSTAGPALLLLFGLALAAWGLTVTVPHATDAPIGYLAKSLYPVLIWSILGAACLVGLAFLMTSRR